MAILILPAIKIGLKQLQTLITENMQVGRPLPRISTRNRIKIPASLHAVSALLTNAQTHPTHSDVGENIPPLTDKELTALSHIISAFAIITSFYFTF
jgi:hypothetical protein